MMKFNQAGVPETLFGLVKHYSPTGEEADVVNWLVNQFRENGYDQAYQDTIGNAIGIKGNGPKKMVFLGHIDTVPGNLRLVVKNGEFWGRGTVDAKGPLAAFVDAVNDVQVHPDWQIWVIGAVGEEGDSRGAWHLRNQIQPDLAVIGEPSRYDRVTLGYKGVIQFQINCEQPVSHSAGENSSAGDKVFESWRKILLKVENYNHQFEKMFEQIQPTILSMSSSQDGFTQKAKMKINVRLPVQVSPLDWKTNWLLDSVGVTYEIMSEGINAYECDRNSELVRAFVKSIRGFEIRPGIVKKTGTADINIVGPVWKCPSLVYGPGDSKLDHTEEERISIQEYIDSVTVIKNALNLLSIARM